MSSGSRNHPAPQRPGGEEPDEQTLYDARAVSPPQAADANDDEDMPTIALEGKLPLLPIPSKKPGPPPPKPLPPPAAGKPPSPPAAGKPPSPAIPADTPMSESGDMTMDSNQIAFDVLARAAFKKPAAATPPAQAGGDFDHTQYLVATNDPNLPNAAASGSMPAARPVAIQGGSPSVLVPGSAPANADSTSARAALRKPPPPPLLLIMIAALLAIAAIGSALYFFVFS